MKRTFKVVVLQVTIVTIFVAAFLCVVQSARAQASAHEGHQHTHESTEKIGQVNFAVSCNPQARRQFNRAVAWLHSFEYEEAEKAFTAVTVADPRCGMAYWGIAMSNYHPLWAPPSASELQKGLSASAKAVMVSAGTQRERDYIAAVAVFYLAADKVDHRTRAFAYSNAMEQLYRRYPADREAGVFYALTLIATGMMANDQSFAREKQAAQILNRVLAREPQHPGVTHYLIHSYDHPELAQLALPAARSYAKIAPASAHARHMPSHIFTRLGLWPEDIQSNLDAEAAAKAFAIRNHWAGVWDEQLHAMDYLTYAYLQGAQDKKALGVLDELHQIQKVEPESFKVAYAATAMPARYALERRQWAAAAKLPLPWDETKTAVAETAITGTTVTATAVTGAALTRTAVAPPASAIPASSVPGTTPASLATTYWRSFPWQRFRWAMANIHFARAVGAARSGDAASARDDIEQLAAIERSLVGLKGDYDWSVQVDIQRLVASAWLAHAEAHDADALRIMRAAAELDDATEKHAVTPGAILPAREQLGELLLELNQPTAALTEFETSLRRAPNRFNGVYGAARAARLAADQMKPVSDQRVNTFYLTRARTYYEKLLTLCRQADSPRPELDEARAFLGHGNQSAR